MDPILKAILLSWNWRLDVILPLLLLGILYTVGWRRLKMRTSRRKRSHSNRLVKGWRLAAYLAGLFFVGLALLSPIDSLGGQLFFMHMIQHLLMIMIAPPLLLIANPMPFLLWGLPPVWRKSVGRGLSKLLHRKSGFRQGVRSATAPGIVWLVWVISVFGWHDPQAYQAAIRLEWLHDVEHLSFFISSMTFWWLVTGAGPHIHKQMGLWGRIAFVLIAVPPNMALGAVLAFVGRAVYPYYEAVPRLWGLTAVTDQQIGGVIMWIPGSMMFIFAALILVAREFSREEGKSRT